MKHPIDPKVDCVFKALLGAERNRRLLIHFLNAILGEELAAPIVEVEILNPYNDREFLDDKLSIVDVKARDAQRAAVSDRNPVAQRRGSTARILYGWADLYSAQLQDGEDYDQLRTDLRDLAVGPDLAAHSCPKRSTASACATSRGGV